MTKPTPANPGRPRGRPRKAATGSSSGRIYLSFELDPETLAALAALERHVQSLDPLGREVSRADAGRWAVRAMAASIGSATVDSSPKSS